MKFKINTLIFLVTFAFAGCKNFEKNKAKKVFTLNLDQGLTSLDPAFARNQNVLWMCNQLFNGLLQIDDSLNLKPCIAKDWQISPDGKKYTFILRNDVYFHNDVLFKNGKGRKVVASDFVYSFTRILDPKIASSGSWIFSDKVNCKNAFVAQNDSIFVINLKKPFPPFLAMLTAQYCSVIPFEVAEKYGKEFRAHPIGTGPFVFKYWKEGEVLAFIKNKNYFEKDKTGKPLPHLDAIKATFLPNKQSAFMEFLKHNLDYFNGVDGSYRDDILSKNGLLTAKYKGKFKINISPYLNTEYLGILVDTNLGIVKKSPLKYIKVRQAINYAIDRNKLIKYLRNSIGTPATAGFVPLGMPGFNATNVRGYTYNPLKAKQLLVEAGYPNGLNMPEITLCSSTTTKDLMEFVQGELSKIGIKCKVEINQSSSLRETIAKKGVNFFRGSWIADYPDAEIYISMFYSKNVVPNGPNYTSFFNKKYDALFESLSDAKSDEERFKLYQQMDQLMMNQSPIVVLYYDKLVNIYHNNISGLGKNAQNLLVLKNVNKN